MNKDILSEKIFHVAQAYKTTAFNSLAIAFTGGVQQLTRLITFTCPCVEPRELPSQCKLSSAYREITCMNTNNFIYGISFILAPAFVLFVVGLLLKRNFWKAVTGHRFKKETETHEKPKYWTTILRALTKSLIYPITWISLALLDGDFLACSLTALPYELEKKYHDCWTVTQTPKPATSHWYAANKKFSQTLGLVVITCSVIVGFVIYTMSRCSSPFTFYHEEFLKNYKKTEIDVLRKKMKSKSEKDASNNVERFLKLSLEETTKELWDRISTIYDFPHEESDHNSCTNLQGWVANEDPKKCHEETDHARSDSSAEKSKHSLK